MDWQRTLVMRRTITFLLFMALCVTPIAGCFGSTKGRSGLMVKAGTTEISAAELRIRMRGLAAPFSGMLEEAADAIIAETSDFELQQEVLLWKINVIPAMQSAIFHPDPLAALFDTWALILQIRNRVDARRGVDLPEGIWPIIQKTLGTMEIEIEALASLASSDGTAARLKDDVEAWVTENPIVNTMTTRPPLASQLAAFNADTKVGIRKTAGLLNEGMMDVAARVDIYNSYLPKQARWQAEYLVGKILRGESIGGALAEFTQLTDLFKDLSAVVDDMPDLVASEREIILKAVEAERIALMDGFEHELLAALGAEVSTQREALTSDLHDEIQIMVDVITGEREVVVEILRQERIAAMEALERIIDDRLEKTSKGIIDYFFKRLIQLLAVVFILIAAGALIFRFVIFRTRKEGRI